MINNTSKLEKAIRKHEKWLHTKGQKGKAMLLGRDDIDVSNLDMSHNSLNHIMLNSVIAPKSDFFGAVLSDASLLRCNFIDSDFSEVIARRAHFHGALMDECNFDMAVLAHSDFREASLCRADFTGANCKSACFHGADLTNADFTEADLQYADFRQSNLKHARLRNANLAYAIGDMNYVKTFAIDTYTIVYTSEQMFIGSAVDSIENWFKKSDAQILETCRVARGLPNNERILAWWNKHKPLIMNLVQTSPCQHTVFGHLNPMPIQVGETVNIKVIG